METILQISICLVTFLLSYFLIKRYIGYAKKMNLLDKPNERKLQTVATPTSGGFPMYFSILLATIASYIINLLQIDQLIIILIVGVVTFLGYWDDRKDISPKLRLLVEFLVSLIIAFLGYRITSFNGLFGIHELPLVTQYLLTIIFLITLMNVFNLIDGIDGLLGGISIISFLVMALLFYNQSNFFMASMALVVASSLGGFLILNYNPAKIFMGDAGSLSIGFLLGIMILDLGSVEGPNRTYNYLISLSLIIIPIFDMGRVVLIRLLKRKSPLSADKNHVHHYLIKFGFNHKKASLFIYLSLVLLVFTAHIGYQFFNEKAFLIVLMLTTILSEIITYKKYLSQKMTYIKKTVMKKKVIRDSELIQKNI